MRRVKSGNSKSLRSAWILFCTSVVSLKLYLCAYTLSALLHCQSCIFYSHLIHGRESDVASTLLRQAPTCVSTCCLPSTRFNSLLSCTFCNFQIYSLCPSFYCRLNPSETNKSILEQSSLFPLSFGFCS